MSPTMVFLSFWLMKDILSGWIKARLSDREERVLRSWSEESSSPFICSEHPLPQASQFRGRLKVLEPGALVPLWTWAGLEVTDSWTSLPLWQETTTFSSPAVLGGGFGLCVHWEEKSLCNVPSSRVADILWSGVAL